MRSVKMRFDVPLIFLIAGNDKLVYPEASRKVFSKIIAGDKAMIGYPDGYHSLSIDTDREKVFGDIFEWMKRRT
jgi:esterase/lipase